MHHPCTILAPFDLQNANQSGHTFEPGARMVQAFCNPTIADSDNRGRLRLLSAKGVLVAHRSALEARWHRFLLGIGHDFDYEPSVIDLPHPWGRYTPDFMDYTIARWIEVKPCAPLALDVVRMERAEAVTGIPVVCVVGRPALAHAVPLGFDVYDPKKLEFFLRSAMSANARRLPFIVTTH